MIKYLAISLLITLTWAQAANSTAGATIANATTTHLNTTNVTITPQFDDINWNSLQALVEAPY